MQPSADEPGSSAADLRLANFVFERASVGIFVGTPDGRFTRVNDAACSMSGYSREELLGMTVADLDASRPPIEISAEDSLLHKTGTRVFESRHRHRDGHTYPVEISSSLLQFEGRDYIVAFVRDITERQEAQRQKMQLEARLAQAQKMESLGMLTGGIAHDFNNSLTVILGYASLLSALTNLEPKAKKAVDGIARASEQSKNLIVQLLGFSRQQLAAPRPLDLNHRILESRDLLARLLGANISISILPGSDLGTVLLDSTQLDRVLMNLAANARDAMPDGGTFILETSNVTVDQNYASRNLVASSGQYVLLAVSDTGSGMDPETAGRVFEPFFTTKEKGTGLGLATLYGIVSQNNGFVHVYSEPGHGTTFKLYFPRLAGNDPEPAAQKRQPCTAKEKPHGNILLIEDDELVRKMTLDSLELIGYHPFPAVNGSEAIAFCRRQETTIDLVISDVVLPDMKGTDLWETLSAIRPGLRVLFVSGYTSKAVMSHGVLQSNAAFLQKPFSLEDLAAKIREVLGDPLRDS